MTKVVRNQPVSVQEQIRSHLLGRIARGDFRPGDRLPSVRQLATRTGTATLTVWNVIQKMAAEGIVHTYRGRGTFVSRQAPQIVVGAADNGQAAGHPPAGPDQPIAQRASTRKVSVVIPRLGDPFAADIIVGLRQVLAAQRLQVTVVDTHLDEQEEYEQLEQTIHEGNGIIAFSNLGPHVVRDLVRAVIDGEPIVLVDRYFSDIPCWHVASDNREGGRMAGRLLLQRGCRRPAVVTHSFRISAVRDRRDGFLQAVNEAGVPMDYRRICSCDDCTGISARKSFQSVVRSLLTQRHPPDGIFFGNDFEAMIGMKSILLSGRRIPDDIAVVGFDDTAMASVFTPALTTIRQNGKAIGINAAQLLLEQLVMRRQDRLMTRQRTVPVELIRRDSA